MDTARYRDLFLTEARDHLVAINQALIALEHAPAAGASGEARESVDAIFRAVTLKKPDGTRGPCTGGLWELAKPSAGTGP